MAQTIKLKRTATPSNVPTTAQLELGEIAVNTYDGNVYIKKNDGADAIVKINANPSDLNYFINGTGTVAGTWLATDPDITSYYDGLVVWYRIGIAGAGTTTLNINGLGAKIVFRYANAKLTTHWPVNSVIPLVYVAGLNGGSFIGGYDWSDGNESYTVRWSQAAKNGASIIHGYQLLMQGADNLMYPVTVGGAANSTTNVVQTAELRMGGQMLYYNSATDIAANATIGGNILYEGIATNEMEYWSNRNNSTPWATAYLPMYLVGTINANGNIILDNSTTTAFLTQTLPTTNDGKVYIQVGWTGNTTDNWRLSTHHPVFEFKGGSLRLYQKDGAGSGLDADLLDGQQGSYYAPATGGSYLPLAGGTTTGTINAPTFNATSTASGGFQGIDADTITAPSFTWTSDLDTGMWHAGTDQIGFTTGGTNRLTVSTTAVTSTLNVAAPTFSGSGASLSALNGSNITTGTVAAARVATLNQSTTGNAATATALQTARTINGVSFNGSANITVEPYIEDDEGTDATRLLVFTDDTTAGFKRLNEDSGLTYNPLNNLLRSNSMNASNFYVGTATTGAGYITSPFTLGNLGLNAGSTAYDVSIGSGATNYAKFTNTLITHYSRLYSAPGTSQTASTPNFESRAQGSGNGVVQYHMSFTNSTGSVNGRITTNNFGTTYATTSDYRVKEDLQEMENATARLLELKPINFKWVGSENRTDGFLAHEVKEIVHDAVVGEKDATETVVEIVVDEEGNETEVTKVVDSLQALDQAKLVPLLVKTIQELEARIRALEAK